MDNCFSLEVPPWTLDWLATTDEPKLNSKTWHTIRDGWTLRRLENKELRLVSICIDDARALDADSFEQACYELYVEIRNELTQSWHPIRLWNFIPDILSPLGDLEHRYMVFNAGRYRAFKEWLDGQICQVATASGVGHSSHSLVVHCLAAHRAGVAVENPRQISAYRYSQRFGPLPPCFARATRVSPKDLSSTGRSCDSGPWLLVGGTASVKGEQSAHIDDLDRQLDETLDNLAAVAQEGFGCMDRDPCTAKALRTFHSLRVYYVQKRHLETIASCLAERLPTAIQVEYQQADLCRPDLLVEIEGIARVEPARQALEFDVAKKEARRLRLTRQ